MALTRSATNPEPYSKKSKQYDEEMPEYTDEELEGDIPAPSDASYFERAQDFRNVIKVLRIKYLGLKAVKKVDEDGAVYTVYQKDARRMTGINEEGVESNVRFLEPRLGKHVVLTNWDEERMYKVIMDDMMSWRDMMIQNFENYEMTESVLIELRILINDLLEYAYRRPIDDKERKGMTPVSKEIRRMLGLDQGEEQQMNDGRKYPSGIVDKMRDEMNY